MIAGLLLAISVSFVEPETTHLHRCEIRGRDADGTLVTFVQPASSPAGGAQQRVDFDVWAFSGRTAFLGRCCRRVGLKEACSFNSNMIHRDFPRGRTRRAGHGLGLPYP